MPPEQRPDLRGLLSVLLTWKDTRSRPARSAATMPCAGQQAAAPPRRRPARGSPAPPAPAPPPRRRPPRPAARGRAARAPPPARAAPARMPCPPTRATPATRRTGARRGPAAAACRRSTTRARRRRTSPRRRGRGLPAVRRTVRNAVPARREQPLVGGAHGVGEPPGVHRQPPGGLGDVDEHVDPVPRGGRLDGVERRDRAVGGLHRRERHQPRRRVDVLGDLARAAPPRPGCRAPPARGTGRSRS